MGSGVGYYNTRIGRTFRYYISCGRKLFCGVLLWSHLRHMWVHARAMEFHLTLRLPNLSQAIRLFTQFVYNIPISLRATCCNVLVLVKEIHMYISEWFNKRGMVFSESSLLAFTFSSISLCWAYHIRKCVFGKLSLLWPTLRIRNIYFCCFVGELVSVIAAWPHVYGNLSPHLSECS